MRRSGTMFESTWSASVVTVFTGTVFSTSRTICRTVPASDSGSTLVRSSN